MKILFIIKYIGKTMLILAAIDALGEIAKFGDIFCWFLLIGACMYCVGSIAYQTELRDRKKSKQYLKTK